MAPFKLQVSFAMRIHNVGSMISWAKGIQVFGEDLGERYLYL